MRLGEDRFIFFPQTGTFDLNATWEKPVFNYSRITSYVLKFRVHEGHEISDSTVNHSLCVLSSLISLFLDTDLYINPLTLSVPSVLKGKIQQKFQKFLKFWKQIAPFESTGREVSFEWSHHRILSTDSKVTTTLRDSNIYSGNERVNVFVSVWRQHGRTVRAPRSQTGDRWPWVQSPPLPLAIFFF